MGLAVWYNQINFNPRPPRGGRRSTSVYVCPSKVFQSTPSARRATRTGVATADLTDDFNPRPPRGGRRQSRRRWPRPWRFQSTPSARRATFTSLAALTAKATFQSTPSARRATDAGGRRPGRGDISIHALREEGDSHSATPRTGSCGFQSTPSARRATWRSPSGCGSSCNFNPRPPRGGRRAGLLILRARLGISIHALREEGDRPRR